MIPSGISDGCKTFLTALNSNTQIATCTAALNTALDAFAPGKTTTPSSADVKSALKDLCAPAIDVACPASAISSQVSAFYSACSAELTTNEDVIRLYDVIFVIVPMQKALCTTNDSGELCAVSGAPLSGSASDVAAGLYTQNGQTIIPNTKAFSSRNIPFLLISPDLEKEALCTSCTRNVLSAYISYESSNPYGPGLSNSQLIPSQADLFQAVQTKCGAKFMDNEVKAAGGLGTSNGLGLDSGAVSSANVGILSVAVAGFLTLAVSAL